MMPTHGLAAFRRLLLGSVTTKVLHDLDCPVSTGIHSEAAPLLEHIHCRRILCAVDLADRSRSILDRAAWLASEYQAVQGIFHATAELPGAYHGWNLEEEFSQSVSEQAKRRIEPFRRRQRKGVQVFVNSGDLCR